MSFLISDSPLFFSAHLAATIGLEEAIMLHVLNEAASFQPSSTVTIAVTLLQAKLPFWPTYDLQRVCKSLADKGLIHLLSAPLTQTDSLIFHFDEQKAGINTPSLPVAATTIVPLTSGQQGANRISANWQPDSTVLNQLLQHHNIPHAFSRSQVPRFITYWRESGKVAHSWNAKFMEDVLHRWQRQRADLSFLQTSSEPSNIQQDWRPSTDALEILQRNGINHAFIDDAIPEFVLYWREKGDATTTWNSKFIQHIKRQWARFTSTLQHDTEPKRLPNDWQPSEDVFDIIKMATINEPFARKLIPEFVLYWKESNQLYGSWNTKFLQHVKYCWANQHLKVSHEGQQNAIGSNTPATGSFIAKHTDRSWADGL